MTVTSQARTDITHERWRHYHYPDGTTLRVRSPLYLIEDSATVTVMDCNGTRHTIPDGWESIEWMERRGSTIYAKPAPRLEPCEHSPANWAYDDMMAADKCLICGATNYHLDRIPTLLWLVQSTRWVRGPVASGGVRWRRMPNADGEFVE